MKSADFFRWCESRFPAVLAADWDNTGLLLGRRDGNIRQILTCLTLTPDVAGEAIAGGFDCILTHHPVLFRGRKQLTDADTEGKMLLDLLAAGISVYCPHTRWDNAANGINDQIANRLGLIQIRPLRLLPGRPALKLVVFVPEASVDTLAEALSAAGAGQIGNYSHCSFRIPGTGTFLGNEHSQPRVGEKLRLENVAEIRLEMVCPKLHLAAILQALRANHPYEEPAYDLYPLDGSDDRNGEGRLGDYQQAKPLHEVLMLAKDIFQTRTLDFVGSPDRSIQRVAIVCGSGGEFLNDALRQQADLFITGEMRFHDALLAREKGCAVILPGHYCSERFSMEALAREIAEYFPELTCIPSLQETDPLQTI